MCYVHGSAAVKFEFGLFGRSLLSIDGGQHAVEIGTLRGQFERLFQFRLRLRQLIQAGVGLAQGFMGLGISRGNLYSLEKIRDGLIRFVLIEKQAPQIDVRSGILDQQLRLPGNRGLLGRGSFLVEAKSRQRQS